jgi:hypothetical protein
MRILFIAQYLFIPIYRCIIQILSDFIIREHVKKVYIPFSLPLNIPIANDTEQNNYEKYSQYTSDFLNTLPENIEIIRNRYIKNKYKP